VFHTRTLHLRKTDEGQVVLGRAGERPARRSSWIKGWKGRFRVPRSAQP
jgi:hypothetical protein